MISIPGQLILVFINPHFLCRVEAFKLPSTPCSPLVQPLIPVIYVRSRAEKHSSNQINPPLFPSAAQVD